MKINGFLVRKGSVYGRSTQIELSLAEKGFLAGPIDPVRFLGILVAETTEGMGR
jgi:hypothetical protein